MINGNTSLRWLANDAPELDEVRQLLNSGSKLAKESPLAWHLPIISRSSLISVLCTIVHTILTSALDISSSDGAFATTAHNGEMTHPERAVMTQSQSAPSVPNLARENAAPADPAFVAKLQQAANLANENCDRATALAHTLSGQLREAQSRINQLELEADGLVERLRADVETVVAKLQSDANARVEWTREGTLGWCDMGKPL